MLGLQRSVGNAAVCGVIARQTTGDLNDADLLLNVLYGGNSAAWVFPVTDLDTALVNSLKADTTLIATIEGQITAALSDDAGPMHESPTYVESPPVADDLRRDLNDWPVKRTLERFAARFAARAAALRQTKLRYPLELLLEASGTLRPEDIDWTKEVAALRGHPPGPQNTVIDASRADRFELTLNVLEREAASGPEPAPGLAAHPDLLGPLIFSRYAATDPAPSELQTDEMTKTHSEAFLAVWLPTIRDTQLISDDLDLAAFEPTGELDAVRGELVSQYVAEAAPRTMEKYLLDRWAGDGRSPEEFVRTADITALRQDLLDHLAKDFPRWAMTQPGFRDAFWSDAGQRAAFAALRTLVFAGRALQAFDATLPDRFATVSTAELSPEEFGIAQDPYGYSQRLKAVADVTISLTQNLKPGDSLEHGLVSWYAGIASVWSMTSADAGPMTQLLAIFQSIGGLKAAVEAQEDASRAAIDRQLDTRYEAIAAIIRNEAQAADEFIQAQWIPMLKSVALEQVMQNRNEMKDNLERWPQYRAEAAAKYRICGHFLDDLVAKLQSGEIDSVTMGDQVVTMAELPQLIAARDFMMGEADNLENDDKAQAKKNEMQEAVDGFGKVFERINNGDYKPRDYSKAVYDEARKRLGIGSYEDAATLGMVLEHWGLPAENPFLAYAVARWEWDEHVAQLDRDFLIFTGLGLLTVASVVLPGAWAAVAAGLDFAVSTARGIVDVVDAEALLDLAELDPSGAVGGVTVEQARQALHTAWIGLGINLLLTAGIGAVWGVLRLAGRGAAEIPAELERLSALAKVNPIAAEKMMAKVTDLTKLEELLTITGDSVLLERMLDKTADVRNLDYVLMFAEPRKAADLIDLAGDTAKLGRVLDHVPDTVTAERLLRMTDDSDGLALLLRSADNTGVAEALLKWTNPRMADQLIGLVGGDQGSLVTLSTTGLPAETAATCLPKCDSASQLRALVSRMDKGPEQVAGLLEKHSGSELMGLLDRGIRPSEIEMGVGTPGIGPQPTFPSAAIPMPEDMRKILVNYGLADHPLLQSCQPNEVFRIKTLANGGGLPKKLDVTIRQKAASWAVSGAKSPGDFVDRWEYFKTRVDEIAETLNKKDYPNQNLSIVAAGQLTTDLGLTSLDEVLAVRAAAMRDLGGIGWADLGGPASVDLVQGNATKLTFGSEAAAVYHPVAHEAELPLGEAPASDDFEARAAAYLASARRTVAEGTMAMAEPSSGATKITFVRAAEGADGPMELKAIVVARDRWALIASLHQKARK